MNSTFDITRTSRKIISQILQNYTLDQLNKIPEGFNNNIIWNIGHIIVVQQMLTYNLSGLPMMISNEMVEKYKKGTKPEHIVQQDELNEMQRLLVETIDKTEADFIAKTFNDFQEYPTSTGFVIKTVYEAMDFNYFHEGLHIGIMMSIRKFI
ncbi:DinB superfamily protein [Flavobacterium segetis]|uniref:DinB superfamily protein n=1 Tax=Flavobacterium segetis TaxID=271157 RepID=A0A1M5G0T4_9FLAO|nr:DinB family protein [Flavobacterium segetis]SHF97375.1 DinB superfamily protein [Flavobacterium segetis]